MRTFTRYAGALVFAALVCTVASAQTTVRLDPASTQVHYTVGAFAHTVHGTFRMTSGTIHFDPRTGAASGEIVIDAASGDSGNRSRDRKMNKEILETEKYPDIRFIAQHVTGTLNASGTSQLAVRGLFRIHGQDHPLTLPVTVEPAGQAIDAQTKFDVPYVAWGMKNPSTFILTVNKVVEISIEAKGTVDNAQTQASAAR